MAAVAAARRVRHADRSVGDTVHDGHSRLGGAGRNRVPRPHHVGVLPATADAGVVALTPEERAWRAAVLWGYIDTRRLVSGGNCNADCMAKDAFNVAARYAKELEVAYWGARPRWRTGNSAICSTRGSMTCTPAGRSCAA